MPLMAVTLWVRVALRRRVEPRVILVPRRFF